MRIKLIANPVSGGDARPRIELARGALERCGAEVDLYLTGARGDARKAAAQALTKWVFPAPRSPSNITISP